MSEDTGQWLIKARATRRRRERRGLNLRAAKDWRIAALNDLLDSVHEHVLVFQHVLTC